MIYIYTVYVSKVNPSLVIPMSISMPQFVKCYLHLHSSCWRLVVLFIFGKKITLFETSTPQINPKSQPPQKKNLDKPPVNLFISHLWKRKIIEFVCSFFFWFLEVCFSWRPATSRSRVITVSPFGQPSCHPRILCSRNAAKLVLPSAWSHGHVHPPTPKKSG